MCWNNVDVHGPLDSRTECVLRSLLDLWCDEREHEACLYVYIYISLSHLARRYVEEEKKEGPAGVLIEGRLDLCGASVLVNCDGGSRSSLQ